MPVVPNGRTGADTRMVHLKRGNDDPEKNDASPSNENKKVSSKVHRPLMYDTGPKVITSG